MSEQEQLQVKATSLTEQARGILVRDDITFGQAAAFLKEVTKPFLAEVDATFDPHIEAAHKQHKALLATKNKIAEPIQQADAAIRGQLNAYTRRRQEEAAAEQRRLQNEARKREEDERVARAAALEKAGERERAAAVLEAPPEPLMVPTVAPSLPQVAGISSRDNWKFRVVDKAAVRPEFMIVDEVAIGKTVRAMKEAAQAIVGGIECWCEQITSVR